MKIVISTTVSMPIYEQIINQIRDAVVSGELKAGDGIPSIRVLAKELAVSVITTKRAYEELEKEGVIESVPGRGFYVCEQKNDLLAGISTVVMMTGDSERTASVIAKKVGVDEYYAEVLPEDKAAFVEREKAKGRKVIMIGDGINDSPALSAANVGIAISDGAEIAREIADITVGSDDLYQIVTLKYISNALLKRIKSNYRKIVGFNSGLIALGVAGVLPPTTTALLHNGSTILISVNSMKNLLE